MLHKTSPANACLAALVVALAGCFGAPALAVPPVLYAQIYLDELGEAPADGNEPAQPDRLLRPDTKQNEDGSAPPQSAQETKQNKLDLQLGQEPAAEPVDRPKLLAQLYDRLGATRDAYAAEPIIQAIEELWTMSGSDTIDLLMSHAERFTKEADLDLSLAILDAAAEIAPEEAEIWHQRARVHVLRNEYDHALADLRRTLNLDRKHYKAINDLGLVLEQFGAKKEALEAYRQALGVNPFLDDARQAVEQLSREVEGQDI